MNDRSCTLLNQDGDVTVVWDESNDEKMQALIQKKMDEGMTFYIIKPMIFNRFLNMKVKAKNIHSAMETRHVVMSDVDFNDLVQTDQSVRVAKRDDNHVSVVRVASNAADAAQNHSVGMTRRVGG